MIDYSQYGQALIIQQLITPDTPRIVIDVGANDGVTGSNSRMLLEQGWRGVLVEPLPRVCENLRSNSAAFPDVAVENCACSDSRGTAVLRIGSDGFVGQMSSLSQDPAIQGNLSNETISVRTVLLTDLIREHGLPDDFGVLLIDTEGHDLAVLKALDGSSARPRIIVTEEFAGTNEEKYAFLERQGYRFAGAWGSDSLWVHGSHPAKIDRLLFPVSRLPAESMPVAARRTTGRVMLDGNASSLGSVAPFSIAGWAWTDVDSPPSASVAVSLTNPATGHIFRFSAWRTPRPDVASVFGSEHLYMSGFRCVRRSSGW